MKNRSLVLKSNQYPAPKTNSEVYDRYSIYYLNFLSDSRKGLNIESVKEFVEYCRAVYEISSLGVIKAALKKYIRKSLSPLDAKYLQLIARLDEEFKEIRTGEIDQKIDLKTLPTEEEIETLLSGGFIYNDKKKEEVFFEFTKKEKLIIETLMGTGLRISELITIEKKNCEKQGNFYKIKIIGKRKKERTNYIPVELYKRIDQEFNGIKFLFQDDSFFHPGKMDYNKRMKLYIQKYRLAFKGRLEYYSYRLTGCKVTPHDFRHYFATKWIQAGKPVKAVSEWLGHSTTAITQDMYTHISLNPEELFL